MSSKRKSYQPKRLAFRQDAEASSNVDEVNEVARLERVAVEAGELVAFNEAAGFDRPDDVAAFKAAKERYAQAKKLARRHAWDAMDHFAEREAKRIAKRAMQDAEDLFNAPVLIDGEWVSAKEAAQRKSDARLEAAVDDMVAVIMKQVAVDNRATLDACHADLGKIFESRLPVTPVVTRRAVVRVDKAAVAGKVAFC